MDIYKNLDLEDLDGEIWKDIEDFPYYQISNFGRVKSFKKYCGIDIRILSQKNSHGYLFVNLCKNGKSESKPIHYLVYESFYEKLKEGECIHHLNEDKYNNIYNNLQKMTKSEHHSLHMSGENHPMFGIKGKNSPNYGKHHSEESKKLISEKKSGKNSSSVILTEQDIIKIWKYLDEGILTQKEIGEKFGVSQITISNIKTRKSWKHVK